MHKNRQYAAIYSTKVIQVAGAICKSGMEGKRVFSAHIGGEKGKGMRSGFVARSRLDLHPW